MNPQLELFSQALMESLLHSLWKAALIAVALKVLLMVTPQRYGSIRHALSCFAILVAAAWSLSPIFSSPHASGVSESAFLSITNTETLSISPAVSALKSSSMAGWLLIGWVIGLVALTVRTLLIGSLLAKLKRYAPSFPAGSPQIRLEELRDQFGIRRRVSLQMSHRISSPMTFGWIRPVIIIPTSMATGMPLNHLEAIMAHELAHIVRGDYLIRILTMCITTLFYFNPGIWWIARQIDQECEAACDDLAVTMLGGHGNYLAALADAEHQRLHWALGFGSQSTISRARRLLKIHGISTKPSRKPEGLLMLSSLVAIVTMIPLRLDGTQRSAGVFIEDTRSAKALLENPSLWVDHQNHHQSVPLFRSIMILEKDNRALNPMSEEEPVFSEFPNHWVRKHSLNFLDSALPSKDFDNDGFSNHEEYLAKTSPTQADSRPSYLFKLQFLESRQTLYPVRYAARPGNNTVQLNSYDPQGRLHSTDLLTQGEITEDGLFQLIALSDQTVTIRFTLSNETWQLTKGETRIPSLRSAILRLPIRGGETIEVEEGAAFRLSHEPGQSFHLESIEDEHCVVSQAAGESRRITRGSQ